MAEKRKNAKEEMLETCASIWKHASEETREWIRNILASVVKPAKVIKWEPTKKANEYELEIAEEVVGRHPDIPIGEMVLKQKMKIAFLEEKVPGKHSYRQAITFPDKGVCHRLGIGWFSKETPLQRIMVEEDEQNKIWCTVEGMGQSVVKPADVTMKFWNKTEWT